MFSKTSLAMSLALAMLAGSPAIAQQAPVPVDSFVKQDQFSSPRLSPDGKHIAIKVRILRNGRMIPTLTVYSLPDLKIVSTMAMDKYEIPVNFIWATNTRLIVVKGIEVGLREKPRFTGEIIAVDLDGKRPQYLFGYKNYHLSSKGERYGDDYGSGTVANIPLRNEHAQVSTYLWDSKRSFLYDIDTVSSTRKLLTEIGAQGLTFFTQRDGTPRFAVGIDDQSHQVVYRRSDTNGEWKQQGKEVIGDYFWPTGFTADNSEFYAMASAKGEPSALIRESLASGKRAVLAQDARSELSVMWNENDVGPFATVSHVGIPVVRYLDPESANAKLHKTLSQQFVGSVVHFINFTDDGSKLLFYVNSDRDPGSYYLYDKKAGTADMLFVTSEDIDPEQMSERRPFAYKARDGVEVFGYLTMPKGADTSKQKLPLVVVPHGGPFDQADSWYFDDDAQFLASRGYAVLQINFRGSGSRGKNFEASGYKEWGGKIQNDLVDGVKAAIATSGIDAKRICSYGISFGGYSALMLPIREPGMFKCAIGYAGVYDLPYIFKEPNVIAEKSSAAYLRQTMGADEEALAGQSPSKLADKVKIPVWLIHGGKDEVAPPEHAKRMREALIKAGNVPDWTMEPDEGHGFYDPQRRKDLYLKLEAFLAKHIGK